jgi:hypothetical protein
VKRSKERVLPMGRVIWTLLINRIISCPHSVAVLQFLA